jgi:L-fuculose-phosphate aldolase
VSEGARIRAEIVEVGRRLYARGLISGNEGNISAREGDHLFITPAGACKGFLTPEDIVRTDLEGRVEGRGRASTEILMHTAIYRRRSDAGAVVTLGPVRVIPYATPSTPELAENVGRAACEGHGLLLANHGALTVGEHVFRAWERMETLEQLARVALVARTLGQDNLLPPADVERLRGLRVAAGYPPPSCVDCPSCGHPVPVGTGDNVILSREALVRLVAEAVERFAGA